MLSLPSTSTSSDNQCAKCEICFQPSHGDHFGVFSCRACAEFFRRSIGNKTEFKCRFGNGKCQAKQNGRFNCKKCRLDRCIEVGMKPKNHPNDIAFLTVTKQQILSSKIPPSLQGFVGRPLLILSCEPDLAYSERNFIDLKFLMDHALSLFGHPNHHESLKSMSMLEKLTYGLNTSRLKTTGMKLLNQLGKAETLLLWEYEFMTVAKWLTYCDEFQQLPKNMKLEFLKSICYLWMRFERIATSLDSMTNNDNKYALTDSICVDITDFDIDISWFTNYSKEQVSLLLDPADYLIVKHIAEPFKKLNPSIQEMTYMLCLLSFRQGGNKLGGEMKHLGDRIIENLSNDLHNYYANDWKLVNYAGRMAQMTKIVQLVERNVYERLERTNIARIFDIFNLEFSHPEVFYGYQR